MKKDKELDIRNNHDLYDKIIKSMYYKELDTEGQNSVYFGMIAEFLARIADSLEDKNKFKIENSKINNTITSTTYPFNDKNEEESINVVINLSNKDYKTITEDFVSYADTTSGRAFKAIKNGLVISKDDEKPDTYHILAKLHNKIESLYIENIREYIDISDDVSDGGRKYIEGHNKAISKVLQTIYIYMVKSMVKSIIKDYNESTNKSIEDETETLKEFIESDDFDVIRNL